MSIQIGINPNLIQAELNKLLSSATTRIRRCTSVKRVALEKIRQDNQNDRAYGFKHINTILAIQSKSYPRYIENIQIFLSSINPLMQKISSIQPLNTGMFERVTFNRTRNNLEKSIIQTAEKFSLIKRQASEIFSLVEGQRSLLRPSMSGNEEADLRHLIEVEDQKSKEIINNLNSCIDSTFKTVNGIVVFQLRLKKFLQRSIKKRGSNLMEDSEALCNKIEGYISAFYAFKSYIQLVGLAAGLFCPIKEVQLVGFAVAGGAFALDWVMDWIAGMPETRRIIKRLTLKMKGAVDQEELQKARLTGNILAREQQTAAI